MLNGLWTTLVSIFSKPITIQYPEQKRPVRARFKGRHVLKRYENGLEKCIGCALCEYSCAYDAIEVHLKARVNNGKCTDCGVCVGVCPAGLPLYWLQVFSLLPAAGHGRAIHHAPTGPAR